MAIFGAKFAGGTVQGDKYILPRAIAGAGNGFLDHFNGFFIGIDGRGKPAFITYIGRKFIFVKHGFQIVKNFYAGAQGFLKGSAHRGEDHKFLDGKIIIGMFSTVDYIHHRGRKSFSPTTDSI